MMTSIISSSHCCCADFFSLLFALLSLLFVVASSLCSCPCFLREVAVSPWNKSTEWQCRDDFCCCYCCHLLCSVLACKSVGMMMMTSQRQEEKEVKAKIEDYPFAMSEECAKRWKWQRDSLQGEIFIASKELLCGAERRARESVSSSQVDDYV